MKLIILQNAGFDTLCWEADRFRQRECFNHRSEPSAFFERCALSKLFIGTYTREGQLRNLLWNVSWSRRESWSRMNRSSTLG